MTTTNDEIEIYLCAEQPQYPSRGAVVEGRDALLGQDRCSPFFVSPRAAFVGASVRPSACYAFRSLS